MNKKMSNPNIKKGNTGKTAKRLMQSIAKYYKKELIIVAICIILSSIGTFSGSLFLQNIVDKCITPTITDIVVNNTSNAEALSSMWNILSKILIAMVSIYVVSVLASFAYNRIMAYVTQGYLKHIRIEMFNKMQKLPIKYFDNNSNGDLMSYYTNDVDAIRQLISQSIPQIITSVLTITALIFIMLYFSIWLTLIVGIGVIAMFFITTKIGGSSAKYFVRQQKSIAKTEGFIEELMNGQKVVKVFCHEEESYKDFDKVNTELFNDMNNAHKYSNILMPMMGNLGNLIYVMLAVVGAVLMLANVNNVSLAGISTLSIGTVVAFLGVGKGFTNNVAQTAQQVNSIVMGIAGAERIFDLLDEEEEICDGYVTLVNAKYDENNNLVESQERTGIWAWKHYHKDTNTTTYKKLEGKIDMYDVDFGYVPDKIVLHDVTIHAKPGMKIAFVGATGAGKTTITNLINRFYDIADGKIRYDDININKIKKRDLRRSLGIVLQDTNLFTGTVKDNIKYGKLDATDEEIIKAAKIANAHDFITRLPQGYDTMLTSDGANLSQGQRQLLSIARAAVADAPVMIMDEATSSIDTRTELLVQEGTNKLMEGRTVFIIAHRLSTVRNADLIIVLDHGRIIEQGNHEELLAKKGNYYQLYTGAFELE